MTWDEIDGWFTFAAAYDVAVAEAPAGSTLVEVGCWHGKSLSYLARKAREADKGLRVIGVDAGRRGMDRAGTDRRHPGHHQARQALVGHGAPLGVLPLHHPIIVRGGCDNAAAVARHERPPADAVITCRRGDDICCQRRSV